MNQKCLRTTALN